MNRGGFFTYSQTTIETRLPLRIRSDESERPDIFHPSGFVQSNMLFAKTPFRHGENLPKTGINVPPHKDTSGYETLDIGRWT